MSNTTPTAPAGALRLTRLVRRELIDGGGFREEIIAATIAAEVEPLVTAAQGALYLLDNSPLANGEVAEALRAALAKWRGG